MTETKETTKEPKVDEIRATAGQRACPVQQALYYVTEFLAGPMCGRCFPCMMGSYEARIRLQGIVDGAGTAADIAALRRIAADMLEASMCKKGKDTARFLTEWLNAGVFDEHLAGRCRARECSALIAYRIDPEKCTGCGLCLDACKVSAIHGQRRLAYRSGYQPFEIRQKRCTKCDACRKVCPEGAIAVFDVREGVAVTV